MRPDEAQTQICHWRTPTTQYYQMLQCWPTRVCFLICICTKTQQFGSDNTEAAYRWHQWVGEQFTWLTVWSNDQPKAVNLMFDQEKDERSRSWLPPIANGGQCVWRTAGQCEHVSVSILLILRLCRIWQGWWVLKSLSGKRVILAPRKHIYIGWSYISGNEHVWQHYHRDL